MNAKTDLASTLFPLGIAEGPGFCNRDAERQQLKDNIMHGTHTYILGIRRYGKTSLVHQTLHELRNKRSPRVHSMRINLLTASQPEALEAMLCRAVGDLSAQFLSKRKRVLGELGKFFAAFKPELSVSNEGFSIRLFSNSPPLQSIPDMLTALDGAALHYKRRAVLVIDEFQQIALIDKQHTIESAIRDVAQSCKALCFVFLGSERTILSEMFEDKKRPLFNSASLPLELNRISHGDYEDFIQNAAQLRWGSTLSSAALSTILTLADRHTHFVNRLCHELWRRDTKPAEKAVTEVWEKLLHRERYQADNTLLSLTLIQRSVLQAIAQSPTHQPLAREYLNQFNIAGSTMKKSIELLMTKDLVRLSHDGNYEVVDPLIKAALQVPTG